jgi:peptide/nickel transport system substrate-binding protein
VRRSSAIGLAVAAAALALATYGCGGGGGSAAGEAPTTAESGGEPPASTAVEASGEAANGAPPGVEGANEARRGGVVRIGVETSFGFTSGFDPTGEYLNIGWLIDNNLLLRTLVNYRHIAGPPGNELIPDLATAMPEVSPDGLTYTFTLKDGIRFAPPVSREITSKDVAYAFRRIATPDLIAQYGFYYLGTIEGMQEYYDGKAQDISGIETPDDKTIVFHLERPTGDFLNRVAMPATAPVPEEVAKCFTQAGEYGKYVIASGPYMLEGSDELDIGSCDMMKPIVRNPDEGMTLVRNPNYDPATDTPEAREALPDRFEFTTDTNRDDIFARLTAGELDLEIASTPPKEVAHYARDESLKGRLQINPDDGVFYISLNLTQPPFDDVHVRRAVNYVMDKEALQRANGGPSVGEIATHIVPDTILNDALKGYDPYGSPDEAGDLEKAKAEMAQSKYDTDKDGICDAPACKNVLHLTATYGANKAMNPIIEESFRKLGIELVTRELENPYGVAQTTAKNIPLHSIGGWSKDYADASTYMVLFDGRTIIPNGNSNYSLVGLQPDQAGKLGIEGTTTGIPSVDADIDACTALTGDERVQCWAELDKKLMEQVVPWIPYLWTNQRSFLGPAVTKWIFDQNNGDTALAHVAVDPSKQQ